MSEIKVKFYNQEAKEIGEQKLSSAVFGVKIKPELVHQAVVAQQANSRQVLAHAKGRSEVRGGGRKPWKQKGTGRARAGSSRSPIWIGGGVTFGPTNQRNFSLKINKKIKKSVLLMCLSDKVKDDKLILLDKIELDEIKTKKINNILKKFESKFAKKIESKKEKDNPPAGGKKIKKENFSALLALGDKSEKIVKSAKNLRKIGTVRNNSLNIVDILKYKYLITTVDSIKEMEKKYLSKK
ncbi:MAG: 50S ribosomal protein L4 [Patescibacteria group bacterium]|nr:50S ribosomal protein L4 [Patescibacteria group bacterium]